MTTYSHRRIFALISLGLFCSVSAAKQFGNGQDIQLQNTLGTKNKASH